MKILLIEDDTKLASVLRQGLKEEGFAIDVCGNGAMGLELATSDTYDVILLDVMLPGKDGFRVVRELRQRRLPTPVLILTARSSVEERVRGLDLGADDYLPKPFDFKELLARIRAISRRPPVEPEVTLRIADLELDPACREVRRGGRRLELSTKEFALLHYLLRKKEVIVTRSMILGHVWDTEYDGGSNLVDVYITYLRRKVDQDFEPKLIHTVRGAGYILKIPDE